MINFLNNSSETPYVIFKNKYDEALSANQSSIEAISISSFSHELNEVDSRFVNLKFVDKKDFIFFSNYESQKALQFKSHDQISCLILWNKINSQIRMKAKIKKTSTDFNKKYFSSRDRKKNALAISSNQSKDIKSYGEVKTNFVNVLENKDLYKCPPYWGGYKFEPYYFEFWDGHPSRINKREIFNFIDGEWVSKILQP